MTHVEPMSSEAIHSATIKALREAQDLSQEGLARMMGVSVRTVARWEGGFSQPSSLAKERLRQVMTYQLGAEQKNG